jgi:hypothetical protein
MGQSFIAARGCVYKVSSGNGGSKGFYDIRPAISSTSGNSPVVIEGVDLTDQDIVAPVATVDNFKVIYTAGTDFGQVRINGLCLLGSVDDANAGQAFAAISSYFNANRVSRKKAPISVSLPGGNAYNVYLTGLAVGQPDTQFNIQPFTLFGLLSQEQ